MMIKIISCPSVAGCTCSKDVTKAQDPQVTTASSGRARALSSNPSGPPQAAIATKIVSDTKRHAQDIIRSTCRNERKALLASIADRQCGSLKGMALLDTLQKDMVTAMKAKDESRLSPIRMLKAALMKHKVDTMKEVDEAAELQILNSVVKQRKDSIDMFRKGNREELAVKEEAELKVIESYMPASATPEQIEGAITAALSETGITSLKQMGVVMKAAQAKLTGMRVDGKALSETVRSKLS